MLQIQSHIRPFFLFFFLFLFKKTNHFRLTGIAFLIATFLFLKGRRSTTQPKAVEAKIRKKKKKKKKKKKADDQTARIKWFKRKRTKKKK